MIIYLAFVDSEADKVLFERIYKRNYKKMYCVAKKILHGHEQSEDAVHEAFLRLAKRFERYAGLSEEKMEALCVTITKNRAIDMWRKEQHLAETDMDTLRLYQPDDRSRIEQVVEQRELSRQVIEVLETLPEVLRVTLELKYYQEYSNREIAWLLQISPKTVEVRLYRGRKKLEELLWSEE
ncbi:MAG: sigma-70 family RNA polymerase sigma factor [Lachnospiraceae bacterium]|nr:sigma-70 family RNA polymerase sigma factor [Lachnospiraceae bacterium]